MRLYEVIFLVIAALMAIAYCGLGVALAIGKLPIFPPDFSYNIPIGIAFFAYGLFRGWRIYRKIDDFKHFDTE